MPAARGGSRVQAKPQPATRGKAPAKPARRPAAQAESAQPSLSPRTVLMIAGGVLTLALADDVGKADQ